MPAASRPIWAFPWAIWAQGWADLPDCLAGARANADGCQQMLRNARSLCRALADPVGRRLYLAQVLADYRRATGQD